MICPKMLLINRKLQGLVMSQCSIFTRAIANHFYGDMRKWIMQVHRSGLCRYMEVDYGGTWK